MAVKEEEIQPKREQDDGKDELAAFDALEKEASEFNKVKLQSTYRSFTTALLNSSLGCRD